MTYKKYLIILSVALLAAACNSQPITVINYPPPAPAPTPAPAAFNGRLEINTPKDGDVLSPTFAITGKAQGWFEGTIPVSVYDTTGQQLYKGSFTLGADNTTQPVNFAQSITLTGQPASQNGAVIFDDYSAKDGSVTYSQSVSIQFKNYSTQGQSINTYTSPAKYYGFSINYGEGFGFTTDINQVQGQSYIPVCDQNMVACAYIIRNTFKATNFDGAGVSINIDPLLHTQDKCYDFKVSTNVAQNQGEDVMINGVNFKTATGGDAGAGHFDDVKVYRNFHNNMCYEISTHVGSSSYDNYPEGTIEHFDKNVIWSKLQGVADSFEFTN